MGHALHSLVFLCALAVTVHADAPPFAFPDCTAGPLKENAVCDVTKDPITRATALIDLWTDDELLNNTGNASPGVARLGLPAYNWWSEGLVRRSHTAIRIVPPNSFRSTVLR